MSGCAPAPVGYNPCTRFVSTAEPQFREQGREMGICRRDLGHIRVRWMKVTPRLTDPAMLLRIRGGLSTLR